MKESGGSFQASRSSLLINKCQKTKRQIDQPCRTAAWHLSVARGMPDCIVFQPSAGYARWPCDLKWAKSDGTTRQDRCGCVAPVQKYIWDATCLFGWVNVPMFIGKCPKIWIGIQGWKSGGQKNVRLVVIFVPDWVADCQGIYPTFEPGKVRVQTS